MRPMSRMTRTHPIRRRVTRGGECLRLRCADARQGQRRLHAPHRAGQIAGSGAPAKRVDRHRRRGAGWRHRAWRSGAGRAGRRGRWAAACGAKPPICTAGMTCAAPHARSSKLASASDTESGGRRRLRPAHRRQPGSIMPASNSPALPRIDLPAPSSSHRWSASRPRPDRPRRRECRSCRAVRLGAAGIQKDFGVP
jgi:hypothetical protein